MSKLNNCTHWIFDMDGTLTVPVHHFDEIREQLNIAASTPILEAIARMPTPQATQANQKLHSLEMALAQQGLAQPGVEKFLLRLRANNCKVGILTRNAEDIAKATLAAAGLAEFFPEEAILGRESYPPKPDPAGIQALLDYWQANTQQSVMVGDYVFDLEAGHRAGVKTVHFDTQGQFDWPQFTTVGVTSFNELLTLVEPTS